MTKLNAARTVLVRGGVLLACLTTGAATSLYLGQDENWDLRNYHLYNGYAALHNRFHTDLAAASLQSWINPTLDVPYAWLALGPLSTHPKVLAALMGLWYGALIAVIVGLTWSLYRFLPSRVRLFATAAATVLAATGAAVFSQVGTTFNEIQTATLVIGAVWLLVANTDSRGNPRSLNVPLAGAMLGAAAGLKITSALFAPAALVSLLAVSRRREVLVDSVLLILGGIAGFVLGGGWWAYKLYAAYGNPVFPFFNGEFHSPWYPPVDFFDRRFLPHTIWQTLFYPLFWIANNRMLVTEIPFRDSRMATAFVLVILLIAVVIGRHILGRVRERQSFENALPTKGSLFLLTFAGAGYVLWIGTTSILRYGIPVEVSLTVSIPLLLWLLLRPLKGNYRTAAWLLLNVVIVAAALVTTRYPAWGRVPYGSRVVSADMSWVPRNALVVVAGAPMAYVVPFTPPDRRAAFVGLTDVVFEARGWRLADDVARRISTHRGPIVTIWEDSDRWRLPSLPDMGLEMIPSSCRTFFGSFETEKDRGLNWCRATAHVRPLSAPFWKEAAQRYDEIEVPEPTEGWSYVGFRNAVGKHSAGKHYVDNFEYLWSRESGRPKNFDDIILPKTLYVLNPSLKSRALRAMNKSKDLLATIDGILVLAPGWREMPSVSADRHGRP